MQIDLLGMDCVDFTCSVLVTLEGKKILFNCGEGLQRLSIEHKLKLVKVEAIFISQLDWEHVGGLPGLLLTLSDAGLDKLTLVGPKGLLILIALMAPFLQRKGFKLDVQEVTEQSAKKSFQLPSGITVHCLLQEPTVAAYNIEPLLKDASTVVSGMFRCNEPAEPHSYPTESASHLFSLDRNYEFNRAKLHFLIQTPSLPGIFNPQKALQLGIPKGPLFGQLKMGHSVTLPNGQIIEPESCVGPSFKSKSFAYSEFENQVEIDSFVGKYKETLKSHDELQYSMVKCFPHADFSKLLECTPKIYFIPSQIPYSFPPFGPLLFTSTGSIQEEMSSITNYYHFSKPYRQNCSDIFANLSPLNGSVELCQPFDRLILHPSHENSHCQTLETLSIQDDGDFFQPLHDFIVFLGTGSALPSMYRNVSSFLVGFPEQEEYFLFDCGEGTFGQLCRKFGPLAQRICQRIKAIFISHLHADHHLGAIKFLLSCNIGENLLTVFAPPCLIDWYSNYSKFDCSVSRNVNFVALEPMKTITINEKCPLNFSQLKPEFVAVPVLHCHESFGFVVDFHRSSSRFRIAYSGDTLPCSLFNSLSTGSDIFVHEATFDDSLAGEAKLRQHCTISQAISCFQESKSKYAILTHFSQRYPKFPEFIESYSNVSLAFDGMHALLDDLDSLSHFHNAIESFFMKIEH